MKIFINENTDDLIKDIRKYVKNTKNSQTTIDTLDLCHMLGKIDYLEEKKRRLEINVLVNDKEIERLNNEIKRQENVITELNDDNEYITDNINSLEVENTRLKSIIKEVREYIENDTFRVGFMNANGKPTRENHILEILDKVEKANNDK